MKKLFLTLCLFSVLMLTVGVLYAQEGPVPSPPFTELPDFITVALGLVSSFIVEFVQKQKSEKVSFLLSIGIAGSIGLVGAFAAGASGFGFASFVVQVFVFAQAAFGMIFKGFGLSKKLKTSS